MIDRNNKLLIYLGIIATVVILIVVVFLINKKVAVRDLIQYAPRETEVFWEFDLDNNRWSNFLRKNANQKKIFEEWLLARKLPANIWQSAVQVKKIAMLVLPTEAGYKTAWLLRREGEMRDIETTSIVGYYFSQLDKSTAVISLSREAVRKVNGHKSIGTAVINQGQKGGEEGSFSFGYMKVDFARDKLLTVKDENFNSWRKYIEIKEDGVLHWQIKVTEMGRIGFTLDLPISLKKRKDSEVINLVDNKFLDLGGGLQFNSFSGNQVLQFVKKEIETGTSLSWESFTGYLEKKYKTNLAVLNTFFKHPVLLVLKPKTKLKSMSDIWQGENFYYALVSDNNLGEEAAVEFKKNLELLLKNYLAFKFPERKQKILPDGSSGYELAADPEGVNYMMTEVGKEKVYLLDKEGEMFGYVVGKSQIIFANNDNLIRDILRVNKKDDIDKVGINKAEVVFDPAMVDSEFWQWGNFVFLNSKERRSGVFIEGIIAE